MMDEKAWNAARELAFANRTSISEAIRQAVLCQRELQFGPKSGDVEHKLAILQDLFALFEGHCPEDEVRRLKEEDEYS